MSIGLGDLLQIIDFQDYLGEEILNVYYYRYFSAPTIDNTAYEFIVDDFATRVIGAVKQIQAGTLTHERVQIKNLSNGVDFFEKVVNLIGEMNVVGDTELPSYNSLGFQLIRDSLVTRNGYKRLAGMLESQASGNEFSGNMTTVDGIRMRMGENLQVGLVQVAAPIIVKRPIPVPAGTAYLYSSVVEVLFKGLGTQNTRKP